MRTVCRSLFGFRVVLASFAVVLLLFPGPAAQAQGGPCSPPGTPPQCDGACPPGQACVEFPLGFCTCVETHGNACGLFAGPPQCWGECPPAFPVCVDNFGVCECTIPTLSEWGIIGMSLVMFGGVLFLRRRREADRA